MVSLPPSSSKRLPMYTGRLSFVDTAKMLSSIMLLSVF